MNKWDKLKEIMEKADKNQYLWASFSPKDIIKLMEDIEERPKVFKVTDVKDNVYYCKPSPITGYMTYICPECGRVSHLCIEWSFHRGFEYCSKCQTIIWESKIITEVYEEDIEETDIKTVHYREIR